MRKYLAILVLCFFVFPAFAGELWSVKTGGAIESKPVFLDDRVVVASQDGSVYMLSWKNNGALVQKRELGGELAWLKSGGGMIVAASGTKIFILDKNLTVLHNISESTIYGIEAADRIYATTDRGLETFSYGASPTAIFQGAGRLTEPLVLNGTVIFGANEDLVVVNVSGGQLVQDKRIRVAPFWKSKPVAYGSMVFIGSTDGSMYAVDLKKEKVAWSFLTGGWIMSDPLYDQGAVYFGSNDGHIYALNANSGELLWKTETPDAIQGSIESVTLAGKKMLLAGGNDNRVYLFDAKSGEIIVTYSADGWVHNPTFYSEMLFFGSYDGFMYAYSVERGCTIDQPASGEVVGYLPFTVSGKAFSRYSEPVLFIRVNKQLWSEVALNANSWEFSIDPESYDFGALTIQCKVSDSNGGESDFDHLTSTVLYRDRNLQKPKLGAYFPPSVTEGDSFQVKAYDENNTPLAEFSAILGGKAYSTDNGSLFLRAGGAGTYNLTVRKAGYADSQTMLMVSTNYVNLLTYAFVLLFVAGVAFYFFVYKKK